MSLPQPLPPHYRRLYLSFIRFACVMTFFALLSGILFQESTRKITFASVGPGVHWEATYHLALVHGHSFMIGVLLPLAVLAMMQFSLNLGGKVIAERLTKWGGWFYLLGSGVAIALMFYKGYHYALSVRLGELNFTAIDHHFFVGQHLLRQIVYGVSHVVMSVGLGMLAVGVWRSLPTTRDSQP